MSVCDHGNPRNCAHCRLEWQHIPLVKKKIKKKNKKSVMIYDVKKYKQAKILVAEITTILDTINAGLPTFAKYKKYKPIQNIVFSMLEAKATLNEHLHRQVNIVRTKGHLDE